MSVFVDENLAAGVERAEADLMVASSRAIGERHGVPTFQVALGGGFATYAGPESPFNKVAGVGFQGLPSDNELTEIEGRFAERGEPVSFEISHAGRPGSSRVCSPSACTGWSRSRMSCSSGWTRAKEPSRPPASTYGGPRKGCRCGWTLPSRPR